MNSKRLIGSVSKNIVYPKDIGVTSNWAVIAVCAALNEMIHTDPNNQLSDCGLGYKVAT